MFYVFCSFILIVSLFLVFYVGFYLFVGFFICFMLVVWLKKSHFTPFLREFAMYNCVVHLGGSVLTPVLLMLINSWLNGLNMKAIQNSQPSSCDALIKTRLGYLVPGNVPEEQFWLLVGISSMHSEKMISALMDYLVNGLSRKDSCELNKVSSGHFSIGLSRLQNISYAVASLSVYY